MKKTILFITLLFYAGYIFSQNPVFDNSISINQTFTTTTEIFPFTNQQMNGVGINGNVTLYSDTSLVRIVLKDSLTFEYMIYETYPMLDSIWSFGFNDECEETCFMDGFTPTSLLILIIDAEVYINEILWSTTPASNPLSFQLSAKQNKVSEKLDKISDYIENEYLIWNADFTYYSDLFYYEKLATGAICLTFPGSEFYINGIYAIKTPPTDDPNINYDYVASFDWRKRHGANDPESDYYDGDPNGGGWITDFSECQSGCFVDGTIDCSIPPWNCNEPNVWKSTYLCWAFGPTAHIESLINLYLNYHADINLSEQNIASCEDPQNPTIGGGSTLSSYPFYKNEGVVDEQTFPFVAEPILCSIPTPTEHIFIDDYEYYYNSLTEQEVRQKVMEHGPICISRYYLSPVAKGHAMQMVGWDVVEWEDIGNFHGNIIPGNELFYAPWVGATYWIYKDSKGTWMYDNGFFFTYHFEEQPPKKVYVVPTDDDGFVYSGLPEPTFDIEDIEIHDHDLDGYFNWGIGPKPPPPYCPPCPDERDADDNNPGLGPMDEFGFCRIIDTYNSGFETSMNYWKQADYDDCNWVKYYGESFDYPYSGPNGTPDGSNNYLVMAYGHCYITENAYIESPPIDLSQHCRIEMNFAYHKNHYTLGYDYSSLSVDISYDDGQTWQNDYWKIDGDQGDEWYYETIYLPSDISKLRFHGYFYYVGHNNGHHHDMALDDITIGPVIETNPIVIEGEVEWEGEHVVCSNIQIEPNSTLTLLPGCEVKMFTDKKIFVKRSAKLVVDNALITDNNNQLWQGIEVWGNCNKSQSYTYQGTVVMTNGGTIENAVYGINTISYATPEGGEEGDPNYAFTGGMVLADGGIFKNNRTTVKFWPYSNFSSSSFFRNCQFITNDDMLEGTDPENFIELSDISGVHILGGSFTDSHTVTSPDELTTGIEAYDARFYIWTYSGPCLFTGLYYGIKAYALNPSETVDIINGHFTDNFRGIYISGMTNAKVTGNNFSINSPFSQFNGGYGLYLDHSTGYKVEENNFYHEVGNTVGVGLVVNQSGGEPNRIYRNYFTNLDCGMNIQGENRSSSTGLELKCNQYEGTIMDKIITWDEHKITKAAGIAESQGSSSSNPEDMAGNLFQIDSEIPNGDFDDILNEANSIIYYYPQNNDDIRVKPVDYTDNVTLKAMDFLPNWTYENGCPPSDEPGGGGGGIEDTKGKMADAGQKIDSTENLLSMLIDGGNTEAVQTDVDNSIPPETMQVYNELMNKSPYLSDTVVSTAIEKEDVLPGAMIRDIMVANPKAAKSEKLMEKLDERWTPLPEYMKAQILQGRSVVSIREETESRLAAFKLEKAKYFNDLLRYYLNDTVNPLASLDSITVLLQNENSLNAKYKLAMMSGEWGAWSDGLAVLNNIPSQFELTPAEAEVHSQITTYYTLLSDIAQQGKSVFEADSTQIATLIDLEAYQSSMASVYARNILLALNQMEYDEPIILPDLLKSAAAMDEYKELLSKADDAPGFIKVKPNPAKDYIIIEYELEQEVKATIEINNISGKLKYSENFKNRQDQFTVDTRNWKAGIYIVTLKINGKLIESVKFTIID